MDANEDGHTTRNWFAVHELVLLWQNGREETISAGARETVLNAAERAGVSLTFGCRTGACSICTGRVLNGHVEHSRPPRALKQRHLNDGYALLCIAEPRADCCIAVGVGVQKDLLSYPRQ